MLNGVPATYLPLLEAWKAPQTGLPDVIRWKKYLNKGEGARLQNSLQHSHAIIILGAMMIEQLRPYVQLDQGLIVTSLAIHDVGEGEIGKDTLYIDKTTAGDLEEYLAFRRRYEPLGSMFGPLHRAFLLQFAIRNPVEFPVDGRRIMAELATKNRCEALAFDAIERWDYFLYALEQYHERNNVKILVQVTRNNLPHFHRLAENLHGFGETIWTDEIRTWTDALLKNWEGEWIEQRGES